MASVWNRGLKFSIFGESHGKAIGVVVDNLPSGFEIDFDKIKSFTKRRVQASFKFGCAMRCEPDEFEILSGIFEGKTTGSPVCAVAFNKKINSKPYEKLKNLLRPGHADYTAFKRYGGFNDFRGAGHLSGRLTAALVFVGALCEQLLAHKNIKCFAHISSVGKVVDSSFLDEKFSNGGCLLNLDEAKKNAVVVLNKKIIPEIEAEVKKHSEQGNSIGGVVECAIFGVEAGVGSPMFDRIENYLADLIFAIPAVKGIEFGLGFEAARLTGLENNDEFIVENGSIKTKTNNCGGVLGGISTGMPIVFKVAIKPTPTIFKEQQFVNIKTLEQSVLCFEGNHDSCIVLRAVVVVEAVANIAMVSQLLNQGLF